MSTSPIANHYTATHPDSRFRRTLTVQRGTRKERTLLQDNKLIRFRNGLTTEQPVARERLRAVVWDEFGIELPQTSLVFDSYVGVRN